VRRAPRVVRERKARYPLRGLTASLAARAARESTASAGSETRAAREAVFSTI
jgi:hypothetical protein